MNNDVEVMLYVSDVNREADFWVSLGFVERDRQDMGETEMVQVAPSEDGAFALNIFDREFIKENSPEVVDNIPSIMFHSDDVEALYNKMTELNVEKGELVEMGLQKVFNFANPDGLYFGVGIVPSPLFYRFACCASVISVAILAISSTDSCIPVAIQRMAKANIPEAVKSDT